MQKSDHQLGMNRDITRRDFIHDLSLTSLGLGLPAGVLAEAFTGNPESAGTYYPPIRTGMRGSHPGAFEVACVFHAKPATDSIASLPPIPRESFH